MAERLQKAFYIAGYSVGRQDSKIGLPMRTKPPAHTLIHVEDHLWWDGYKLGYQQQEFLKKSTLGEQK